MAIYLSSLYGTRFYGPDPDINPGFDIESFRAASVDYRTIEITWDHPTGEIDGFRLLKSPYGYPVSETGGIILLDSLTAESSYTDSGVQPGRFYYYAVYIKISGVWVPAGYTSCLHIVDHNSGAWLWYRLPIHYRMLRGNQLTLEGDDNVQLARYMGTIGWGLDRVRTSIAASAAAADTYTTHIGNVDTIIAQLGLPDYPGIPALRKRGLAREGAAITATRGTTATIQAAGKVISGWEVQLRRTRNLLLTVDRAQMVGPLPIAWEPSKRYVSGDRVRFYDVSYVAKTTSYGWEQCPDGERRANTWWDPLLVDESDTIAYDPDSKSQHGWQPLSLTPAVTDDKVSTSLMQGTPRPGDPIHDCNAIGVHNNATSTTATIAARCLPAAWGVPLDQMTPILHGIPLQDPPEWEETGVYPAGSVVLFQGRLYHAVKPGRVGSKPRDSDRWQVVGTDNRYRLTLSAYIHQPHNDITKPTAPATVFLDCYDDRGKFLGREFGTATDTRVLDTFTAYTGDPVALLHGRTSEYGAKTWTDQVGSMRRESYTYGVVHPADDGERSLSTVDYGSANAQVACTFASEAADGQVQAIILRYSSPTTYVRATRTALQTVNGATVTTLVSYSTPIADGDRLTVAVSGNNYTVSRNGTQVGTATSSFNSSATHFGLAVEA